MKSIFLDKHITPTAKDVETALGETHTYWQKLVEHTYNLYPDATEEWHFSSEKFGWSFRIKDKKRILMYLLPRDKFFKVAFVFGQKATDEIMESNITEIIKNELQAAKVYAEGRGIRIEVRDNALTHDLLNLIHIKIKY